MNIHHLELFYYVAKNGGISQAVRKMPYGIQQPAVSAQILRLEEDLDAVLFQRRPFRLTNSGQELFCFIEPFFAGLDEMTARLRGASNARLRLAASGPILRNYFPSILARHREKFPSLRLTLRETNQYEAETLLQAEEIDLAITELEGTSPPGIKSDIILKLPLALMVTKNSPSRSAERVLQDEETRGTLIALPGEEALTRSFQEGFAQSGLRFTVGIEVSSLDSMKTYVANGFGIGLSVAVPGSKQDASIRVLPLAKFPKLVLGALWSGKLSGIAQSFLDEVKTQAAKLSKER